MELGLSNTLLAGDPRLVDHIVGEVKSQGIFDQFRKECIADVDTKPAYQNLRTRVEGSVNSFLGKQPWKPDLNKNQLRETLRKHIHDAPYLDAGVERIVDQVVNPKVYSVFMPQIEDVVYKFLGLERPKTKEKNGACGLKDLLPKDLDPVSPESDKNSLKDVSLESVDAIDSLDVQKDEKLFTDHKSQEENLLNEKVKDTNSENGHISSDDKLDEINRSSRTGSNSNLNTSGKSDDKTEEDEEDSPTFEPIDIMNLNESNISNDSHLSGISELTSHRSRSPDFCTELSRDNFEYSNQDSQLSKVSSDSRLSIVTDFGSSNHASTPTHELLKEEVNKDKCDAKYTRDNFKMVREFESCRNKNAKNIFELNKNKDLTHDIKDSKSIRNSVSSKENSRDAIDSTIKDKHENKNNKDKLKDNDLSKLKSKDKNHIKDSKYHNYKDKNSDKKKQRSYSGSKIDKYDKNKLKDKCDQPKEDIEKTKDIENYKDHSNKLKEDKIKELNKKDNGDKEIKDLKDLYKEKIRELREKKELTEKEKLNKDSKEIKSNKDSKDKKDSPKDKKSNKKEHKSSSSKNSIVQSVHEGRIVKSSEKMIEGKDRKTEIKEKDKKHNEKHSSKDKSKNHLTSKESVEKLDKQEQKKLLKPEKEDKSEKLDMKKDIKCNTDKTNGKRDTKYHSQTKTSNRNEKLDYKKDTKSDSQGKDKKRRDEKKSKSKDDHSSLRKNSNDRRSSDRDGSNGSSSKSSHSNTINFNSTNAKSDSSNLSKESGHVNNSSSETSDSIEERHTTELQLVSESHKINKTDSFAENNCGKIYISGSNEEYSKGMEIEQKESNLPLKKRPLFSDENTSALNEIKVKKPKFAKNIHEAKKLMKIRKQIEKQKQKQRENRKIEKKVQQKIEQPTQINTTNKSDNLESVPDEERVQIIEIPDEEYEEPYPEQHTNLTLEEGSIILLGGESCTKSLLQTPSSLELKLSDMELRIKQSLSETIPSKIIEDTILQHSRTTSQSIPHDTQTDENLQNIESKENNSVEKLQDLHYARKEFCENKKFEHNVTIPQIEQTMENTQECDADTISNELITEETFLIKKSNLENTAGTGSKESCIPLKMTEHCSQDNYTNTNINTVEPPSRNTFIDKYKAHQSTSKAIEDNEDCKYFKADSEKSEKFTNFLETMELTGNTSLEDIIESLGGQIVSSVPKTMAPPLPKRKHSSSPLTDILLNNSNNNNDGHKNVLNSPNEDALNTIKKRKIIPKKQRVHANLCTPQGLLNGENFVMPLSPESDVSATSEKIPSSNLIKEEKGRHRSSQRYSSDDLYKPRPLFSSSSRRSRRSNQA